MKICTIASSSSGNCTLVTDGSVNILIDAGVSMRRIVAGLRRASIAPENLTAVLVTHEHSDHINGLPMLLKYYETPVFTTRGTAAGIRAVCPAADRYITEFSAGDIFELGSLSVRSFPTPHDTPESVGFRLTDEKGKTFVLATDTGHLTDVMLEAASGADAAVIEANHDIDMLKYGGYPAFLKRRILSDRGHMSNKVCGCFAQNLVRSGTRTLILAHLSRENNTPELARAAVEGALREIGAVPGEDLTLAVAPRCEMSGIFEL